VHLIYDATYHQRTRYLRPVYEDERVEVVVQITDRRPAADGRERLVADVTCLTIYEKVATAGESTIVADEGGRR
jgi:hypothetical protein